jgi:hypothetical protein
MGNWIDLQPEECPPLEKGCIPWLYADGVRGLHICNVRTTLNEKDAGEYSIEPIIRNSQIEHESGS